MATLEQALIELIPDPKDKSIHANAGGFWVDAKDIAVARKELREQMVKEFGWPEEGDAVEMTDIVRLKKAARDVQLKNKQEAEFKMAPTEQPRAQDWPLSAPERHKIFGDFVASAQKILAPKRANSISDFRSLNLETKVKAEARESRSVDVDTLLAEWKSITSDDENYQKALRAEGNKKVDITTDELGKAKNIVLVQVQGKIRASRIHELSEWELDELVEKAKDIPQFKIVRRETSVVRGVLDSYIDTKRWTAFVDTDIKEVRGKLFCADLRSQLGNVKLELAGLADLLHRSEASLAAQRSKLRAQVISETEALLAVGYLKIYQPFAEEINQLRDSGGSVRGENMVSGEAAPAFAKLADQKAAQAKPYLDMAIAYVERATYLQAVAREFTSEQLQLIASEARPGSRASDNANYLLALRQFQKDKKITDAGMAHLVKVSDFQRFRSLPPYLSIDWEGVVAKANRIRDKKKERDLIRMGLLHVQGLRSAPEPFTVNQLIELWRTRDDIHPANFLAAVEKLTELKSSDADWVNGLANDPKMMAVYQQTSTSEILEMWEKVSNGVRPVDMLRKKLLVYGLLTKLSLESFPVVPDNLVSFIIEIVENEDFIWKQGKTDKAFVKNLIDLLKHVYGSTLNFDARVQILNLLGKIAPNSVQEFWDSLKSLIFANSLKFMETAVEYIQTAPAIAVSSSLIHNLIAFATDVYGRLESSADNRVQIIHFLISVRSKANSDEQVRIDALIRQHLRTATSQDITALFTGHLEVLRFVLGDVSYVELFLARLREFDDVGLGKVLHDKVGRLGVYSADTEVVRLIGKYKKEEERAQRVREEEKRGNALQNLKHEASQPTPDLVRMKDLITQVDRLAAYALLQTREEKQSKTPIKKAVLAQVAFSDPVSISQLSAEELRNVAAAIGGAEVYAAVESIEQAMDVEIKAEVPLSMQVRLKLDEKAAMLNKQGMAVAQADLVSKLSSAQILSLVGKLSDVDSVYAVFNGIKNEQTRSEVAAHICSSHQFNALRNLNEKGRVFLALPSNLRMAAIRDILRDVVNNKGQIADLPEGVLERIVSYLGEDASNRGMLVDLARHLKGYQVVSLMEKLKVEPAANLAFAVIYAESKREESTLASLGKISDACKIFEALPIEGPGIPHIRQVAAKIILGRKDIDKLSDTQLGALIYSWPQGLASSDFDSDLRRGDGLDESLRNRLSSLCTSRNLIVKGMNIGDLSQVTFRMAQNKISELEFGGAYELFANLAFAETKDTEEGLLWQRRSLARAILENDEARTLDVNQLKLLAEGLPPRAFEVASGFADLRSKAIPLLFGNGIWVEGMSATSLREAVTVVSEDPSQRAALIARAPQCIGSTQEQKWLDQQELNSISELSQIYCQQVLFATKKTLPRHRIDVLAAKEINLGSLEVLLDAAESKEANKRAAIGRGIYEYFYGDRQALQVLTTAIAKNDQHARRIMRYMLSGLSVYPQELFDDKLEAMPVERQQAVKALLTVMLNGNNKFSMTTDSQENLKRAQNKLKELEQARNQAAKDAEVAAQEQKAPAETGIMAWLRRRFSRSESKSEAPVPSSTRAILGNSSINLSSAPQDQGPLSLDEVVEGKLVANRGRGSEAVYFKKHTPNHPQSPRCDFEILGEGASYTNIFEDLTKANARVRGLVTQHIRKEQQLDRFLNAEHGERFRELVAAAEQSGDDSKLQKFLASDEVRNDYLAHRIKEDAVDADIAMLWMEMKGRKLRIWIGEDSSDEIGGRIRLQRQTSSSSRDASIDILQAGGHFVGLQTLTPQEKEAYIKDRDFARLMSIGRSKREWEAKQAEQEAMLPESVVIAAVEAKEEKIPSVQINLIVHWQVLAQSASQLMAVFNAREKYFGDSYRERLPQLRDQLANFERIFKVGGDAANAQETLQAFKMLVNELQGYAGAHQRFLDREGKPFQALPDILNEQGLLKERVEATLQEIPLTRLIDVVNQRLDQEIARLDREYESKSTWDPEINRHKVAALRELKENINKDAFGERNLIQHIGDIRSKYEDVDSGRGSKTKALLDGLTSDFSYLKADLLRITREEHNAKIAQRSAQREREKPKKELNELVVFLKESIDERLNKIAKMMKAAEYGTSLLLQAANRAFRDTESLVDEKQRDMAGQFVNENIGKYQEIISAYNKFKREVEGYEQEFKREMKVERVQEFLGTVAEHLGRIQAISPNFGAIPREMKGAAFRTEDGIRHDIKDIHFDTEETNIIKTNSASVGKLFGGIQQAAAREEKQQEAQQASSPTFGRRASGGIRW